MRLRLVCAIAIMLPSDHRQHATARSACPASRPPAPLQRAGEQAQHHRERGELRAPCRSAASTAVGAPWYTSGTHMWNGTAPSLNAIAGHDEHEPEHQQRACSPCLPAIALRDHVDVERAGGAVDHRHAVEQHARRRARRARSTSSPPRRRRLRRAAAPPARTATATSARGRGRASGSCCAEIITIMPSSANSVSTNVSPRNRPRATR